MFIREFPVVRHGQAAGTQIGEARILEKFGSGFLAKLSFFPIIDNEYLEIGKNLPLNTPERIWNQVGPILSGYEDGEEWTAHKFTG